MTKIIMSGCNGRMGQAIVRLAQNSKKHSIVAGYDANPEKKNDFPVYSDFAQIKEAADVMIDFSHISATSSLLTYCKSQKLPLVLATTGISGALEQEVFAATQAIPIFKSSNTSLGISLLLSLVRKAARVLGETSDIEIIEKHHNQKVDAPSGTALVIADAIKSCLDFEPEYVYDRTKEQKKREHKEIGIHAVRGGNIIGDHEVLFIGSNETISIGHFAQSRELFAEGALKAAEFMKNKTTPGLYNMDDLVASII